MNGRGEKLSRKQEQAIAALLTEPTVDAAAKAVGVSPTTLWRWRKLPGFAAAFSSAKEQSISHAIAQLQGIASEAVHTLRDTMNDEETPATARVSAAKAVLDLALRASEAENLKGRVEEVERLLGYRRIAS